MREASVFIVLLKFSENRDAAGQFMAGHRDWLQQGFADGVFLLAGSLQPVAGGSIIAHATTREALLERVAGDPFVMERVVTAELLEIAPSRMDERMRFLLE